MTHYWAIRTDKHNRDILLQELHEGRLRQGWGYEDSQNLAVINAEIKMGGDWWQRLTTAQQEAYPHFRMLGADPNDSVQIGDVILVPNLPAYGYFMLARVTGPYRYEPITLDASENYWGLERDYGHILPVELITPDGVNKFADIVDASIRSTLRTPMRMWNLDNYADLIERIIAAHSKGHDVLTATTGEGRLASAWESALAAASRELTDKLGAQLDAKFQAAEWEEPIKLVLQSLYPNSEVIWTAGPSENGADLVLKIPNHFDSGLLPWVVLIQIKNYQATIGPDVLKQLRTAYESYRVQGKILSLVVMTTAEKAASELQTGAENLAKELGISVEIILHKRMLQILSDGLLERIGTTRSNFLEPLIITD